MRGMNQRISYKMESWPTRSRTRSVHFRIFGCGLAVASQARQIISLFIFFCQKRGFSQEKHQHPAVCSQHFELEHCKTFGPWPWTQEDSKGSKGASEMEPEDDDDDEDGRFCFIFRCRLTL